MPCRALPILVLFALPLVAQEPAAPRPAAAARAGQAARPALTTAQLWDRAYFRWDAGHFDSALVDLRAVLNAADAASYSDRVAELTGEIWHTVEVAKGARAPIWSPDGRLLAFESDTGSRRRVTVVRAAPGFEKVAETEGYGATFSPDGQSVAVLRVVGGRPTVRVLSLQGAPAQDFAIDAGAATQLTLVGRGATRLLVIVGQRNDIASRVLTRSVADAGASWQTVEIPERQPVELLRSGDGTRVLVTLGARGPFARPVPGFAAERSAEAFAEVVGATLAGVTLGTQPTWSRDGSTYAWVDAAGDSARIRVRRGSGEATTAAVLGRPWLAPALSPTGRRVAYATMLREDWELYAAPSDGSAAPQRLTREIQHDLLPQFLTDDRLLAVMGEARHRRSHLYDLRTGVRTRMFHNNTVRTVAPEYEWVPSPDGLRVAVVSERDGDTVTPHRHLYVTDLATRVPRAALLARVDSMLGAERQLRAEGRRRFAPIAAQVRAATAEVSVGRIYDYQRQLFGFDSKHITQPGNMRATEWLREKYASFGLNARLQRFTTLQGSEIDVANVIATIPGTVNPELVYVVGAHFDSRAEGPGADDNTSGTAMLLEAARVLATRPQPATVMFVAFTGEESGLRGAREFGRRMKDSIHVVGALNNDMMGWSNDHRLDNTIRYSNPGIRDIQHAAAIQFSQLVTYDAFYFKSTDAHALYDAWGDIIGGIGSYPILGNPHYHMPHDVLETINHRQLAETSKTTVATIMLLASSPSRLTGLAARGNIVTWNRAVERGVTRYIVRFGPANDPMRSTLTVTAPRATIPGLQSGMHVAVKAVNAAGLEGWDWARTVVP